MSKRLQGLIACLITSALILTAAIGLIVEETNLNLNKTKQLTGFVIDTGTETRYTTSTKFEQSQLIFYFVLNNSSHRFTVYRSDRLYTRLLDSVVNGVTIKVYYKSNPSEYDAEVYQVEKNGQVIYDYSTYNKQVSSGAGMLLLMGVGLLIYGIIAYTKFNLWTFLYRLPSTVKGT